MHITKDVILNACVMINEGIGLVFYFYDNLPHFIVSY